MTSPRIIEARRKLAKSKKWGAAVEQRSRDLMKCLHNGGLTKNSNGNN